MKVHSISRTMAAALAFFSIAILTDCAGNKKSNSNPLANVDPVSVASRNFNVPIADINCTENGNNEYSLCIHPISEPGSVTSSVEFVVISKSNGDVLMADAVTNGKVRWFSDSEIEVVKIPGTMAVNQTMADYTFIIEVKSGKQTKKSVYQGSKNK